MHEKDLYGCNPLDSTTADQSGNNIAGFSEAVRRDRYRSGQKDQGKSDCDAAIGGVTSATAACDKPTLRAQSSGSRRTPSAAAAANRKCIRPPTSHGARLPLAFSLFESGFLRLDARCLRPCLLDRARLFLLASINLASDLR